MLAYSLALGDIDAGSKSRMFSSYLNEKDKTVIYLGFSKDLIQCEKPLIEFDINHHHFNPLSLIQFNAASEINDAVELAQVLLTSSRKHSQFTLTLEIDLLACAMLYQLHSQSGHATMKQVFDQLNEKQFWLSWKNALTGDFVDSTIERIESVDELQIKFLVGDILSFIYCFDDQLVSKISGNTTVSIEGLLTQNHSIVLSAKHNQYHLKRYMAIVLKLLVAYAHDDDHPRLVLDDASRFCQINNPLIDSLIHVAKSKGIGLRVFEKTFHSAVNLLGSESLVRDFDGYYAHRTHDPKTISFLIEKAGVDCESVFNLKTLFGGGKDYRCKTRLSEEKIKSLAIGDCYRIGDGGVALIH